MLFNKESQTTSDFEINYFKNIITGLNEVIQKILILDVKRRPDAMKALTLYQDFLKKTQPDNMSLPRGRTLFRNSRNLRRDSSKSRSRSIHPNTRSIGRYSGISIRYSKNPSKLFYTKRRNKTIRNRTKRTRTRK